MKIVISGSCGKMGRVIAAIAPENGCTVVAGIDRCIPAGGTYPFPLFTQPSDLNTAADVIIDVIIDYSHPTALPGLLSYCKMNNTPIVIATTGYSEEEIAAIKAAATQIPIFFTFNMSLGINLLAELSKIAARVLCGKNFDIEIIEKHHNLKKDAPSGTAIMLADAVTEAAAESLGVPLKPTYDRHTTRRPRDRRELGIHSVRGGTIVGEHEVIFAGHDEVITLSHSAGSKEVFAAGSLSAAKFLAGKPKGLYNMSDLIATE